MTLYYAHSGISEKGIPAQLYSDHIKNMYAITREDSLVLSPFLRKACLISVLFHDFGKLDPTSQVVLSQNDASTDAKMINHVDAGVGWCIREYNRTKDESFIYGAYLVHAHHIGLRDRQTIFKHDLKNFRRVINVQSLFRDNKFNAIANSSVMAHFDSTIDNLFDIQYSILKEETDHALSLTFDTSTVLPIEMRFALGILIESDHGDTSRHYGLPTFSSYELRPSERLLKLSKSVKKLQKEAKEAGISDEVIASRNVLYDCANSVKLDTDFYICAAPTGKGKTISLMNLALRIAEKNASKRIFFIIPLTNIISQSVKIYRKYVSLPGENPQKSVNEIHSKVEFTSGYLRKYSHLWSSPINVSTSIQFFESLFSNHPSSVRKLMQFANSVVVFDEYHTALPHYLWEIVLHALKVASKLYNIKFVFGSGTHVYYWEIFSGLSLDVTEVVPNEVFTEFNKFEKTRIKFTYMGTFKDDFSFYKKFDKRAIENGQLKGNTVIVCNTITNAAMMTQRFVRNYGNKWKIFHLSSYLTPKDREAILDSVREAMASTEKILLISTTIIECGIDISFEVGFREVGSLMSAIQLGGRVNRNKERAVGILYEFAFESEFTNKVFTSNPNLSNSIAARKGIVVSPDSCTQVISAELAMAKKNSLVKFEGMYEYNTVDARFKVIDRDTLSVIVNSNIVDKIKQGIFVSPVEINRNSVSIYKNKVTDGGKWECYISYFSTEERENAFWTGPYDKNMFGVWYAEISTTE